MTLPALPAPAPATKAPAAPGPNPANNDPANIVSIDGNSRVFIVGKTGSGKTFWAMYMLADQPRLVVIDLKGSETISGYEWDTPGADTAQRLRAGRPVRVRVRDFQQALEYMQMAYDAGGVIVYVDEILMLAPKGGRPPLELEQIWTRGRELGVGGWAATQRPVYMPLWLVSESEWTICFRLRMDDDRKRMADDAMGDEVRQPITDVHGFFVNRDDWDRPNYYRGVQIDFDKESE